MLPRTPGEAWELPNAVVAAYLVQSGPNRSPVAVLAVPPPWSMVTDPERDCAKERPVARR